MFRFLTALVFLSIYPLISISSDQPDFDSAEKAIKLLSRSCLSSTRITYKIEGKLDLSILKKIAFGGEIEGDAKFDKVDIISYLPDLKDELQQAERDAIRKCINPMLPDIFDQYGILKKKQELS